MQQSFPRHGVSDAGLRHGPHATLAVPPSPFWGCSGPVVFRISSSHKEVGVGPVKLVALKIRTSKAVVGGSVELASRCTAPGTAPSRAVVPCAVLLSAFLYILQAIKNSETEAVTLIQKAARVLGVKLPSSLSEDYSHKVKSIRETWLCVIADFREWQEIKLYASCSVFLRGYFYAFI